MDTLTTALPQDITRGELGLWRPSLCPEMCMTWLTPPLQPLLRYGKNLVYSMHAAFCISSNMLLPSIRSRGREYAAGVQNILATRQTCLQYSSSFPQTLPSGTSPWSMALTLRFLRLLPGILNFLQLPLLTFSFFFLFLYWIVLDGFKSTTDRHTHSGIQRPLLSFSIYRSELSQYIIVFLQIYMQICAERFGYPLPNFIVYFHF